MKKEKLLVLFGNICLVVALIMTLSGGLGLALADKPQKELPPLAKYKVANEWRSM